MAKKQKKGQKPQVNYRQQHRQKEKVVQQQDTQKRALQSCTEGELCLSLQAFDTWFFRESRPHDAAGASELNSLFPPPIRTLAGAVRTFMGDAMDIDWQTLNCAGSDFDFEQQLGNAEHLGQLQLNGAWVIYNGQRLYPAPAYLMKKENELKRLEIGNAVRCDLGTVRLPQMPEGYIGYKNLEQHWLTGAGMRACLEGGLPKKQQIISLEDLLGYEPRLGIARDNQHRAVEQGKLYQTQHIRLKAEVGIEINAKQLAPELVNTLNSSKTIRLGGEGRMASIQANDKYEAFPFSPIKNPEFCLHFITPADFGGDMFPEAFNKIEHEGETVWRGIINEIEFDIVAAVIGKAHREGGWDMKNHQPRAVKSYTPAGSTWFCRLTNTEGYKQLNETLHNHCIGLDTDYGRGHILLGQWPETQNNKGR